MSAHRFVLLLFCLLLQIRLVGVAAMTTAVPDAAHGGRSSSTCVAMVVGDPDMAVEAFSTADDPSSGVKLHPHYTCANLCSMPAALPVTAWDLIGPAASALTATTPSVVRFIAPPPHEPPRRTA